MVVSVCDTDARAGTAAAAGTTTATAAAAAGADENADDDNNDDDDDVDARAPAPDEFETNDDKLHAERDRFTLIGPARAPVASGDGCAFCRRIGA